MRNSRFGLGLLAALALTPALAHAQAAKRVGDVFVFSDGVRARAVDPQGRAGTAKEDGSIHYADGTVLRHDSMTGDTSITRPDGSIDKSNTNVPRREGDAFVFGDGTRVRAVDPSGKAGIVKNDGSIVYSDGTVVTHDSRSGDTKLVGGGGRTPIDPYGGCR